MALSAHAAKRLFSAAFQIRCYSAPAERAIPAAKQKYVPTSGQYPKGFVLGTAHAGVKASNTKYDDVTLVASETPCNATAVFTRNIFQAAPVLVSKAILKDRTDGYHGVIINSGCANAVTGHQGKVNATEMAIATDRCFDSSIPEGVGADWTDGEAPSTLVMSTGVIGQHLPMDRIKEAIPKAHASLGSTHEHWMAAAQAICTTDTFPKLCSRSFTLPSHPDTTYRVAGITKGAGMIHPNMGTLLGVICTDVNITSEGMKRLLLRCCSPSFNAISIDGDTSTNDTIALLANGAAAPADAKPLHYSDERLDPSSDEVAFARVLRGLMLDLAKLVVRDGEGATKFVTVCVQHKRSAVAARQAATSIATSALVKTALYGKDANWGRILCAIGYAPGLMKDPVLKITSEKPSGFNPSEVSVSFEAPEHSGLEDLPVFVRGEAQNVDEEKAKQLLELEDINILVNLTDNPKDASEKVPYSANFYTCDFSHEYVTINGDYRT